MQKYLSAGTKFRCQNLMSIDDRSRPLKAVPTLKRLMPDHRSRHSPNIKSALDQHLICRDVTSTGLPADSFPPPGNHPRHRSLTPAGLS